MKAIESGMEADHFHHSVLEYAHQDFIMLPERQSVGEAIETLRTTDRGGRVTYYYVEDDGRRLVGVLAARKMLTADPKARLGEIMIRSLITLPDTATVLDACEFFILYRLLAVPIVRADGTVAGVVDVSLFTDEMTDVAEKQAADDLFQLIGVRVSTGRKPNLFESFRSRFPWLLANIAGGMLCAFLLHLYEPFLDAVLVLALFIPVVLALSESVSIQSMTLTLQALHGGQTRLAQMLTTLKREFVVAAGLGAACGAVVGVMVRAWIGSSAVALVVGVSIFFSIITACFLGVLLPFAVRAFRGDPKIAAGPVTLALADLAALLFYFQIGGIML